MSTSDKFPPLSEPLNASYIGLEHEPAGPPSRLTLPSEEDSSNKAMDVVLAGVTWIASVVLLFAMSLIFVLPYAFRQMGMGQESLQQFLLTDKTAIFLQIASTIPAHLLTLGMVWAVVTRLGNRPFWSTLGWSWGRNFGFWSSACLAIGLLGIGMLITNRYGAQETQVDKMIASSMAARYITAFLATFTAPLVEEMVYRGVLYSALQRVIGTAWAVAGVLLLFTLIHVPQYWPNFAVIAVIGLLSFSLTIVRASTGRLLPCFIIHLVFNGISSVLIIFEPYLQQLRSSGEQKAAAFVTLAHALHLLR